MGNLLAWIDRSYENVRERFSAVRKNPWLLWNLVPERFREKDPLVEALKRRGDLAEKNLESAVKSSTEQKQAYDIQIAQKDEEVLGLREDLTAEAENHKAELRQAVNETESRLSREYNERLSKLNREVAAEVGELKRENDGLRLMVGAQKETNKELRNNKAIVPSLRVYEAENPALFARLIGLYLDNKSRIAYATPAFLRMTQVPEERILTDESSRSFACLLPEQDGKRKSRLKFNFGGKTYEVRQRAYQIKDGYGEVVGTFVHITNLDKGLFGIFTKARTQARKEYAAMKQLLRTISEAAPGLAYN